MRARSSTPSGPRLANHGRDQGGVPSQSLSWQTGSSYHQSIMQIDDSSDPWLDHTSNCWPLEKYHYAESVPVSASYTTANPPPWSGLFSPHAVALRENRGICLNCHESDNTFKHCRHPFITVTVADEIPNLANLATMTHTDIGRHAEGLLSPRKIVTIFKVNCEGTIRISAGYTTATITNTRRITMVASCARPPLLPPAFWSGP